MSFLFNPPTSLAGMYNAPNVDLTWNAAVLAGDPTVLLLHGDGSNGSTTYIDSTQYAHSVTNAVGAHASLTTTDPKFGTAALNFPGETGGLRVPLGAEGSLGSGDWTWETFYKSPSPGASTIVFWTRVIGDTRYAFLLTYSALILHASGSRTDGTTAYQADAAAPTISDGAWHHIAMVRHGDQFTLYLDGVAGTTTYPIGGAGFSGTLATAIDGDARIVGDTNGAMQLDELRLTVGQAMYTSNFTPPTAPFSTGAELGDPGYILYRDDVEIGSVGIGVLTYSDLGVAPGTYTYNVVASYNGVTADSDFSNDAIVNVALSTENKYGSFAGAATFVPTVIPNVRGVRPRIYMPLEDITVRTGK